jgi:hypothetical protein
MILEESKSCLAGFHQRGSFCKKGLTYGTPKRSWMLLVVLKARLHTPLPVIEEVTSTIV